MAVESLSIVAVYARSAWADDWEFIEHLKPITSVDACSPQKSTATLVYRYGRIKRADDAAFAEYPPLDITDNYIKITAGSAPDWYGVAAGPTYEMLSDAGNDPTGMQTWECFGLEHILDQVVIDNAVCEFGAGTTTIDYCPAFNLRNRRGGTLLGNRSALKTGGGYYCFSDDGEKWSVRDVLEYVLGLFVPSGGPTWCWGGQFDDLDDIECEPFDAAGMTLRDCINSLIDRRRGYSWSVRVGGPSWATYWVLLGAHSIAPAWHSGTDYVEDDIVLGTDGNDYQCILDHTSSGDDRPSTASGQVTLWIFSLLDKSLVTQGGHVAGTDGHDYRCKVAHTSAAATQPITGADYATVWVATGEDGNGAAWAADTYYAVANQYDRNMERADLDMTDVPQTQRCEAYIDRRTLYDQILVRGGRVKACFTISSDDSTLEAGWAAAMETAYEAGASGDAGYAALTPEEQAAWNKRYRADERFRRVFAFYRIPQSWTWEAGDGVGGATVIANPSIDADGTLLTAVAATYWNHDRRLLSWLPLRRGVDYSVAGWTDENPSGSEADFRGPLVLVKDGEGKYRNVEDIREPGIGSASVSVADREMGLYVRFNPAHLLGRSTFSSEEPDNLTEEDEGPPFDWREMIVTVAAETDERLQITQPTPTAITTDYDREMIIEVPDAELWYIASNAVVGVDTSGDLLYVDSGGVAIRDDSLRLREIAALAVQWHGKQRVEGRVERSGFVDVMAPGSMVLNLMRGANNTIECNSVVTKQAIDYRRGGRVVVEFGWWGVDWARMVAASSPPPVGKPAVARNINDELKRINADASRRMYERE